MWWYSQVFHATIITGVPSQIHIVPFLLTYNKKKSKVKYIECSDKLMVKIKYIEISFGELDLFA